MPLAASDMLSFSSSAVHSGFNSNFLKPSNAQLLKQNFKSTQTYHSALELKTQARMGNEDYWSEDFDTDQNCAERARIAELQEKVAQQVDPADWDLVDQGQTFYSLIVYWVIGAKKSIDRGGGVP